MSLDFDALYDRITKSIYEANEKQTVTLKTELKAEITEVKGEITELKRIIQEENNKRLELEKRQCDLENRYMHIERSLKKNNIIVFGLEHKSEDLVNFTISKLNNYLGLNITLNTINNVYSIGRSGKNQPIIVEFVSFLTKVQVLRECKKLKGTQISISHDLTKEDRRIHKVLLRHKKEAQRKGYQAFIKRNRLHINNEIYTAEELEQTEHDTKEAEVEENKETVIETESVYIQNLSSSAPATPTVVNKQKEAGSPEDSIEKNKVTKKRKVAKTTYSTRPVTRKLLQGYDNKERGSPNDSKAGTASNENQRSPPAPSTSTNYNQKLQET